MIKHNKFYVLLLFILAILSIGNLDAQDNNIFFKGKIISTEASSMNVKIMTIIHGSFAKDDSIITIKLQGDISKYLIASGFQNNNANNKIALLEVQEQQNNYTIPFKPGIRYDNFFPPLIPNEWYLYIIENDLVNIQDTLINVDDLIYVLTTIYDNIDTLKYTEKIDYLKNIVENPNLFMFIRKFALKNYILTLKENNCFNLIDKEKTLKFWVLNSTLDIDLRYLSFIYKKEKFRPDDVQFLLELIRNHKESYNSFAMGKLRYYLTALNQRNIIMSDLLQSLKNISIQKDITLISSSILDPIILLQGSIAEIQNNYLKFKYEKCLLGDFESINTGSVLKIKFEAKPEIKLINDNVILAAHVEGKNILLAQPLKDLDFQQPYPTINSENISIINQDIRNYKNAIDQLDRSTKAGGINEIENQIGIILDTKLPQNIREYCIWELSKQKLNTCDSIQYISQSLNNFRTSSKLPAYLRVVSDYLLNIQPEFSNIDKQISYYKNMLSSTNPKIRNYANYRLSILYLFIESSIKSNKESIKIIEEIMLNQDTTNLQ